LQDDESTNGQGYRKGDFLTERKVRKGSLDPWLLVIRVLLENIGRTDPPRLGSPKNRGANGNDKWGQEMCREKELQKGEMELLITVAVS